MNSTAAHNSLAGRLPLRIGVLRYQFPTASDNAKASVGALIKRMCEECVGLEAAGLFRIDFDRGPRCFDVLELLDAWDEKGRRATRVRGLFDIGDNGFEPVLDAERNDLLASQINAAISRLYSLFEASVKRATNAGRVRVWAKQGTLARSMTAIPAQLFAKYTVTDWFHGNAEADGGVPLFDIHLELTGEEKSQVKGSVEQQAIKVVAQELRERPNLSKADAGTALVKAGVSIRPRAFNTRVWSRAREAAGLPAKAAAGRKKRNHCA